MLAVAEQVVRVLEAKGARISVAESCTGGLIASLLLAVPGSSKVFPGGVIAYANLPKRKLLNVPEDLLRAHGAVSAEAVTAMAEGARQQLETEFAVGVSGIAGPTGGSAEKPIGTVFMACVGPNGAEVERHNWQLTDEDGLSGRERYMQLTAEAALQLVLRRVQQ